MRWLSWARSPQAIAPSTAATKSILSPPYRSLWLRDSLIEPERAPGASTCQIVCRWQGDIEGGTLTGRADYCERPPM
jgi:hypothetical protein